MFEPSSRYAKIDDAVLATVDADGTPRELRYKRRRFIPSNEGSVLLFSHVVRQGERIDQVAATYLGDPAQFYRLCDENGAAAPADLVAEPGRRIRVAMPRP